MEFTEILETFSNLNNQKDNKINWKSYIESASLMEIE